MRRSRSDVGFSFHFYVFIQIYVRFSISMLAWGLGRPAETTKSGGGYASYIHIVVD